MPGPNDYHLPKDSDELHPGLGKDEPSEEERQGIRSKSAERLQALKDELRAANAELTQREKALIEREQAQINRERELEQRLREIEKREKESAKAAKGTGDK